MSDFLSLLFFVPNFEIELFLLEDILVMHDNHRIYIM